MKQTTLLLLLGIIMLSDSSNLIQAETVVEDITEGEQPKAAPSRGRPKLSPEEIAQRKKSKKEQT